MDNYDFSSKSHPNNSWNFAEISRYFWPKRNIKLFLRATHRINGKAFHVVRMCNTNMAIILESKSKIVMHLRDFSNRLRIDDGNGGSFVVVADWISKKRTVYQAAAARRLISTQKRFRWTQFSANFAAAPTDRGKLSARETQREKESEKWRERERDRFEINYESNYI